MGISEKQKLAVEKYKKEKIKRVPLDMQKEDYEKIKEIAESCGESVNGYIKEAIKRRIASGS